MRDAQPAPVGGPLPRGHLLAGELRRSTSRRSSPTGSPLEASHGPQPLSGPGRLLQVGRGRGRSPLQPHGGDATGPAGRATSRRGSGRAADSAAQDLRGSGLHQPPRHRRHPAVADPEMRPTECVGMTLDDVDLDQRILWVRGRVDATGRCRLAARRPRHWTATSGPGGTSAGSSCRTLDRPQRPHDPVGYLPGRP